MSFSLNKLKSFLPTIGGASGGSDTANGKAGQSTSKATNQRHSLSLDPEVGFQLMFEPSGNDATSNDANSSRMFSSSSARKDIPVLNVHLIGARHLPSSFGFKTVQGYLVKVKLFPGSEKFDSTIQTTTWPKFNENFKFPLGSEIKSCLKSCTKNSSSYSNLPETCFSGHFVVFTVFALLELPPGSFNRFKETYRSLRDKGGSFIKGKMEIASKTNDKTKPTTEKPAAKLTQSESRRNIGCVTYFLQPKHFRMSSKGNAFVTEELWLPIKDITVTSPDKRGAASSNKGQIEIILELCKQTKNDLSSANAPPSTPTKDSTKKSTALDSVKKKVSSLKSGNSKMPKTLCLKVTTSRMRCSIKVKDEFENCGGMIYVKTKVFEHDILCSEWKSDNFLPSLSIFWNTENSTIVIPLLEGQSLDAFTVKTTVACKNKMGKKITLGTVTIGPKETASRLDHWNTTLASPNKPIPMFHNFT